MPAKETGMIRFSNGHELRFACGSGALAFNGKGWLWEQPLRWTGLIDPKLFTVVAKTVTFEAKSGNLSFWHPWTCVRLIQEGDQRGATNAVGLTNPGYEHWVEKDYPVAKKMGYKIAASIKPETPVEAGAMAYALSDLELAYVEVNLSCPNVEHVPADIPEILRYLGNSKHPLVVKLSYDQVNPIFVKSVERYVEAFHAINTIPWAEIFPDKPSPIEKQTHGLKGGVSGDFIHEHARRAIQKLKRLTSKPIIAGGGISSVEQCENFLHDGADAFSIGTLFLNRPWKPCQIVREYERKYAIPE
jgi:dihydroorotate dehydrogenase